MIDARILLGSALTLAAIGAGALSAKERQFTPGVPLVGIFAQHQLVANCELAPPAQLISLSPTELSIFNDGRWWRATAVEHRAVLVGRGRPGFWIRGTTAEGDRVELAIVPWRKGFELFSEESRLANGNWINRPRRHPQPGYLPCPEGTTERWVAATGL